MHPNHGPNHLGGAHVDPALPEHYHALSRKGSVGMSFAINGLPHTPKGPEKLIVSHIGLEAIYSLKLAFSAICPDFGLPNPFEE